jgi:hypothetical protein
VNIKLESPRGEAVHAANASFEADPADVIRWAGRTFRYVRTDGIFDQKKHVYREASVHDLPGAPAQIDTATDDGADTAPAGETTLTGKRQKNDRQISATLTAAQAALLKRVRARGAHASTKAALIAGLEALEKKHTMSNEALLTLLSERLEETRTESKQR